MKTKKPIAVLFALLLIFSFPVTTFAAEKDDAPPIPNYREHLPYYYHQLETEEQRVAYITARKAIIENKPTVSITYDDDGRDFIDALFEVYFYNDDYTFSLSQVEWESSGRADSNGNRVYKLKFKYKYGQTAYRQMVERVDKVVDKFVASIKPETGTFTKVLKVRDFIAGSCVYDLNYKYNATPYGALIGGKALCEGYARSFNYICNELGLSSVMNYSEQIGSKYGHAWNKVKIGKDWYIVDITNDDTDDQMYGYHGRDYMFLGDDDYTDEIEIDEPFIVEPKATNYDNSYYEMTDREFSTYADAMKYMKTVINKNTKLPAYVELRIDNEAEFNKFVKNFWDDLGNPFRHTFRVEYLINDNRNVIHIYFYK
jgi:hypothetical protein